jgi:hypothetical protein
MRIALPAVVLSLAVVAPAVAEPGLLRGTALPAGTGLRLVVADNPPFVLDVDTGKATPVRGVRPAARGTSVIGVAGRAAVVVTGLFGAVPTPMYAVRDRVARVSALGAGADVVSAPDGGSVWIKSSDSASRCALRQIGLDGKAIGGPRPFPCASTLYPGGSLGIVVNRTRVIDPLTGRTLLRTRWGVLAAAGRMLVLDGPGDRFTLLDTRTHAQRRLPWPSTLNGLDAPAADPRGRFVALAFADPAYRGGQLTDVWLLATKTARLTHLPGMPAFVSLKRTSMVWTHDGRLVLLGESNDQDVVAVWRPGQKRLATKIVQLPYRSDSGSDSFAPLG